MSVVSTPGTSTSAHTVGDVVGVLEAAYPLSWAES